ncbi:prepilin-type N-terminal cleavage/methylation domain-containing protein [Evansella clarkii]|uniref:prepilin-type N-terminal cleavage/methylation domain-containing protein n=1 Tax=Evansella clarkii TaxID=79879 RepID=UPI00147394ED|nr:prepilin-type N-terminal cleavage/methylation domain-containing protein [Evansella clarkii]
MKNSDGFTLTEVMAGLLVFAVSAAVLLPAINLIYMERMAVREERAGEEAVHYFLHRIIMEIDEVQAGPVQYKNKEYIASVGEKNGILQLCMYWEGVNEREYERCLSAPFESRGNNNSGSHGRSDYFSYYCFFYPCRFYSAEYLQAGKRSI